MPAPADTAAPTFGSLAEWVQTSATLPVLPDLAMRVITLAADPDVSISQLTSVISKDQVLTTRLLALANSAHSASRVEITTIAEAVMRVGAVGVRNLAVAVCMASQKQDRSVYGAHGQALVDHGIGTAYLARLIADEVDADAEEAFLCGLLHDIGKLVVLKWVHTRQQRSAPALDDASVEEMIVRWHAGIAGMAFRRWSLPASLDEPVTCHHDFERAEHALTMAAVVYLANRLSHRYGFGCDADGNDPLVDPVMTFLGLTPEWLAALDKKAPGLYAVARQITG
jgi:putative nucleotidyltransferase with HDIG domain